MATKKMPKAPSPGAAYQKTRYHERKEQGRCPRCGTKLTAKERRDGNVYCKDGRDYLAARARARKDGDKRWDVAKPGEGPTSAERAAEKSKAAFRRGDCITCYKRPARDGRVTCAECSASGTERRKRATEREKQRLREAQEARRG